jgi:DNA-binding NarL/FixJ family response regulator
MPRPPRKTPPADALTKHKLLADFCKRLLEDVAGQPSFEEMPSRQRQTLELLLEGKSEKEAAHQLGISRNTLHIYVRALYKRFSVSSRGELLAKCLRS